MIILASIMALPFIVDEGSCRAGNEGRKGGPGCSTHILCALTLAADTLEAQGVSGLGDGPPLGCLPLFPTTSVQDQSERSSLG